MKKFYVKLLFLFCFLGIISSSFGQVIITEIADPDDEFACRYLELHNPSAADVDLSTGWTIRLYSNANTNFAETTLTGTIPAGGYYIICSNGTSTGFSMCFPSATCNQTGSVNSNGDDNFELVDDNGVIIDSYGIPGVDGTGTASEFEDGRVERATGVCTGSTPFDPADWNICSDAPGSCGPISSTDGIFDPGIWEFESSCAPPPPPMPTCFYTEDFEDATVDYVLSQAECNDTNGDYFTRTDGSNVGGTYNNPVGTSFFAAQDIDGSPCMMPMSTMKYDNLAIANFTNIELCVYLAEDQASNGAEDWDAGDFLHINYDIDNSGTTTPAIWVEADPSTLSATGFNGLPRIDTDFDGEGDGAEITDNFTQYCFTLPATGSVMDIEITFAVNAGDEDIAIDELTLCGIFVAPTEPTISQTDVDGDGISDITDPCACDDPENLSSNGVVYFHDFVTIISDPGETWTLTNLVSGNLYAMDLTTTYGVGTAIPEIAPGVYQLVFWTESTVGFSAEFNRSVMPVTPALAASSTCDASLCCDLTGNIVSTVPSCVGDSDGTISFTGINCTTCAAVEYSIDNVTFQSSPSFTGLTSGTYQVFARDTENFQCIFGIVDFDLGVPSSSPPVIICPPADITVECDAIPTAPTLNAVDLGNTGLEIWINEFHYDNTGGDVGEFIEVAGIGCTDLTGYTLELYNGSNGTIYNTTILGGEVPDEGDGFGAVSFPISGIQNGAPDGIALVQNGNVIQFLSYEGTFTATNGTASGMTSTDVGVFQPGSNPVMLSLQLMGTGTSYNDFTWSSPSAETPGVINNGQTLQSNVVVAFNETTVAGGCEGESTITRVWTATDDCGNTMIHAQTISVEDNTAPQAVCQNISIELDQDGNATILPSEIDNGSSDICGTVTLSLSQSDFSCSNIGDNTVTLTATDDCGNTSTCTATVTVVDNLPPVMTCPSDQTIHLDPGACEQFLSYNVTAVDNCEEMLTTTFIGTTFNDNNGFAGNMFDVSNISSGPIMINSFDIHLGSGAGTNHTVAAYSVLGGYAGNETNAAVWTLMGDVAVVSAGPGNPSAMPAGGLTIQPGEVYGIYIFQTDGGADIDYTNGANTYADANVQIETGLGRGTPIWTGGIFNPRTWNGNIHYTVAVGAAPVIQQTAGLPSGSPFPIGTTVNTWTATDNYGNTSSCTWEVTVVEYVPSSNVINCNSLVNISLDENCEATVGADQILEGNDYGCYDNYEVVFANSGLPVILDGSHVGQTFEVMVTNPSGNPCWGNIFVEDKLIPDLVCSNDLTVRCDDDTDPGSSFIATSDMIAPTMSVDNATVSETVTFGANNGDVVDVNVTVNSDHTWVGDLVISITSPSGTTVELMNNIGGPGLGCAGDGLDLVFDDAAALTYADLDGTCNNNPAAEGTFQPLEALSVLNGEPAAGDWTVSVQDLAGGDSGDVNVTINLSANSVIPFPVPAIATVTPTADPFTFNVAGFDPCGNTILTYADVESGELCDGNAQIERTWTATDESGNTTSCTEVIFITPTTLADVVADLPGDITIECGDALPAPLTDIGCSNIGIALYGEPTIIDICEGSYKMLRKYILIDWCDNSTLEHLQIIKVLDTGAPIVDPIADMTISTNSNDCTGSVQLPVVTATDACSSTTVSVISISAGTLNAAGTIISDLPIGTHTVTYTATDGCGNEGERTLTIIVEDQIAPIAICDEFTIVGIGSDGNASVDAITFDDGSTDNCEIVEMLVRRMDNPNCPGFDATPFGPSVPFTCCDVNTTVIVEFQVTDAAGNVNSCMVEVEVQDKINPTILCAPNADIDCTADYLSDVIVGQPLPQSAIDANGEASATDNCPGVVVTNSVISSSVVCGAGTITIVWTATDAVNRTASCIQRYFVTNSDPFVEADITWPLDYTANTCGTGLEPSDLSSPYDYPVLEDANCSNIAVGHDDQVLDFGAADACLKILRKWYVVDWCQADGNQDPTQPGPGVWHYTQIIKVINSTAPTISCEPDNGINIIPNINENCEPTFVQLKAIGQDDCTPANLLEFTWALSDGQTGIGNDASQNLENGDYTITFTVTDLCGNTSDCTRDFSVVDAKKPTPVCIFGIATTVMPSSGSVTIWASDFESGSSFDNCTAYEDLQFSFSEDVTLDNITINCDDIPADGLVPVSIYVTDEAGNFDFCSTFINVQDPNGACASPTVSISGVIENEVQEVIEEVNVKMIDMNGGLNYPLVVTGANGEFSFTGVSSSNGYNVTPTKNINYLNGVTTYDLVLISKHILGTELLDSPYKIFAADANNSQSVTTLDIVKLRALILHIEDELTDNSSWRFVDANHIFTSPINPWETTIPEDVDLSANGAYFDPANFVAVKIGDVNGSASPNSLLGSDTRTLDGTLAIQVKETKVEAGETFTIDFRAKDFTNISGYQFTLGFDQTAIEFVDVITNLENLGTNNFGLTKLDKGVITTSWNNSKGISVDDDAILFSITFVANNTITTNEIFKINSRYTASEAYANNDLYDVVLAFNAEGTSSKFELYQNTPNPFKAETTIGFNMPEAGEVTLKIYDVSGRVLKLIEVEAVKGFNSVNVSRGGIDATGVLYYQLETATETATKKMILVD
jgi:subtilisin-like proprotein convertase family protein